MQITTLRFSTQENTWMQACTSRELAFKLHIGPVLKSEAINDEEIKLIKEEFNSGSEFLEFGRCGLCVEIKTVTLDEEKEEEKPIPLATVKDLRDIPLKKAKETIIDCMDDWGYHPSGVSLGESLPGVYAEEFESDGKRFLVEYDTTETDEDGNPRLNISDSDTEGNFATLYPKFEQGISKCIDEAMNEVEKNH